MLRMWVAYAPPQSELERGYVGDPQGLPHDLSSYLNEPDYIIYFTLSFTILPFSFFTENPLNSPKTLLHM